MTPVTFELDRLETNPRFAAIARPANAAILVKLRIDMEDRGGRIELLLPYATLEPIRKMLLQQFLGEKFGRDNIWESHLATELWTTQMEVRAVLDEQSVSLKRVLDLQVGETLLLNATGRQPRGAALRDDSPDARTHGPAQPQHRRPRRSPAHPGRQARGHQGSLMNPVVLSLEGLLAVLLGATLFMGLKLERKLKALRNSQAGFATAVRDLDTAAARTEAGLDALRYATEGARDVLIQRMEAAQAMALRLEELTAEAETAAMRAQAAAETADKTQERIASAAAAQAAAAAASAAAAEARAMPRLETYAPQAAAPRLPLAELETRSAAPIYAPRRSDRTGEPAPMPAEAASGGSRLRQAAELLRGSRR
jgi:hypothetical protein